MHSVARPHPQGGFMLLSVLASILIFAIGLLGIAYFYARVADVGTQDQNLREVATEANAFWGLIQANPGLLDALQSAGGCAYTSANYANAPGCTSSAALPSAYAAASLQNWLLQVVGPGASGTAPIPNYALPGATVTITPGPDAASGTACSSTTGCSVTLQISWTQNVNPNKTAAGITRSQTFYYQFVL